MKTRVASVEPFESDPVLYRVTFECGHGITMCERDVDLCHIFVGRAGVECSRCDRPARYNRDCHACVAAQPHSQAECDRYTKAYREAQSVPGANDPKPERWGSDL